MPIDPKDAADQFDNSEQRDGGQAQDVAAGALARDLDSSEDSEHGGNANPAAIIPDDMPDLVDRMDQMVSSGIIDMGAFAGEPLHDDNDPTDDEASDE